MIRSLQSSTSSTLVGHNPGVDGEKKTKIRQDSGKAYHQLGTPEESKSNACTTTYVLHVYMYISVVIGKIYSVIMKYAIMCVYNVYSNHYWADNNNSIVVKSICVIQSITTCDTLSAMNETMPAMICGYFAQV